MEKSPLHNVTYTTIWKGHVKVTFNSSLPDLNGPLSNTYVIKGLTLRCVDSYTPVNLVFPQRDTYSIKESWYFDEARRSGFVYNSA